MQYPLRKLVNRGSQNTCVYKFYGGTRLCAIFRTYLPKPA